MRLDGIVYGPHSNINYETNYFYDETSLQYGYPLNDSNDSISWGFQFPKTGTVNSVGIYAVEYLGNPDYVLAFAVVSGNLLTAYDSYPNVNPTTKTIEFYSNSQWQVYEPEVVGSGWNWIDLSTPVSVTKGDIAALTIIPSGAVVPSTSNYVELNNESNYWNPYPGNWRYATGWTYLEWESPAGIKYDDNAIYGYCVISPLWEEFASPAEWGVEFKLPVQATCLGGVLNSYPVGTYPYNCPFKLILADSTDTELASITILDYDLIASYNNYTNHLAWDTSTDPVLEANTIYRLYVKPTSAEPFNKSGVELSEENAKINMIGGTDWKWIERSTPASGWTYQPTYYPHLSVILTDIQAGTGGQGSTGQTNSSYGFIG